MGGWLQLGYTITDTNLPGFGHTWALSVPYGCAEINAITAAWIYIYIYMNCTY